MLHEGATLGQSPMQLTNTNPPFNGSIIPHHTACIDSQTHTAIGFLLNFFACFL